MAAQVGNRICLGVDGFLVPSWHEGADMMKVTRDQIAEYEKLLNKCFVRSTSTVLQVQFTGTCTDAEQFDSAPAIVNWL